MPDTNQDNITKTIALLVTTMASFLTPFDGSSVNIALPSIQKEFAISAIQLSWVATAFLLASALFLVPFGKLADIYGRKKIFKLGILIFTISSFFCAISNSGLMLITLRVFQGLGAAMIFGTGIAILTSVYPVGERGKALGINVAATYLGLSLGPFLGGILTEHFGWRSIFSINIPLGIILFILVSWKLKGEWSESKKEKFDLSGSIIYSLSLVLIMYGFTILPTYYGGILLLAGIAGICIFYFWETSIKNPVLNMNLFRNNRVFTFSNIAALINYCATFAVAFLLSLYLQYNKGFSPQMSGLILITQPIVMFIFSPFAGRLSDRIEPRIVSSAGMAFAAVGLSLFAFINETTSIVYIICVLMVLGFGFALFSSPNTNAVMSSVEKRSYGVASSTLATMRLVGQMLSLGIATMIFAIYIGNVQIVPQNYPLLLKSINISFILFAILCFIGIFASLARGKVRNGL